MFLLDETGRTLSLRVITQLSSSLTDHAAGDLDVFHKVTTQHTLDNAKRQTEHRDIAHMQRAQGPRTGAESR